MWVLYVRVVFFFFQAEDGIRDDLVTGVQTCALPFQAEDGIRDDLVTGVQTCALPIDRKSTRLNSSQIISYAVFCLKSKKNTSELQTPTQLVCVLLFETKSRRCETLAYFIMTLDQQRT